MSEAEDSDVEPVDREDAASDETLSTMDSAEMSASSEETFHIQWQEPEQPSTSQRRFIPPDGMPPKWWERHRKRMILAEWLAIAFFFGMFLYYVYLLFNPPVVDLTADWKVAAQPGRWRYVVLHHSATAGGNAESFDRFHREKNGWENGLGYHFVIGNGNGMEDGEVVVGHRWRDQLDGAHVRMPGPGKANSFSIGVALVGDFDKKPPTKAQLSSLVLLLRFLGAEYGIGKDKIVGHGAVALKHTECPGKFFPKEAVLQAVDAKL